MSRYELSYHIVDSSRLYASNIITCSLVTIVGYRQRPDLLDRIVKESYMLSIYELGTPWTEMKGRQEHLRCAPRIGHHSQYSEEPRFLYLTIHRA